jgi:hypothetical protein
VKRADTKETLHLVEFARLLQAAKAGDDRAKKVEQQQDSVLIKEQPPVARPVACRAHLMQMLQQRHKQLKVLDTAHVGWAQRLTSHGNVSLPSIATLQECSNSPAARVPNDLEKMPCRTVLVPQGLSMK